MNFNRVFHYKPSILGYPYFWKHPYVFFFSLFLGALYLHLPTKNTNFNHNPQPQRTPSTLQPFHQPHLRGNGPTSSAGNEVKTGSESSVELIGRLQTFNTLPCRVVWRIIFVWGGLRWLIFKVRVEKLRNLLQTGLVGGRLSNILKRVVVAVFFFVGGIPKMGHFFAESKTGDVQKRFRSFFLDQSVSKCWGSTKYYNMFTSPNTNMTVTGNTTI